MVMILLASFALAQVRKRNRNGFPTDPEGSRTGIASRRVITVGPNGLGIAPCPLGRKTRSGLSSEVENAIPPPHHSRFCANIRLSCTRREREAKPLVAQLSSEATNAWNSIPGVVLSAMSKQPLSRLVA